ncbi:SMI1/KNR4 family protein [Streptomyces sp. TRM49041]|uniref:SMI1/KNR4 family protein n=1 Tax=Streptomyces sp. TRM49041 TaxID=2603216 RepID=UPI0011ED3FB7|nr:SMI1/KNR4 family protein [Streptomyces sp. TRM49041]
MTDYAELLDRLASAVGDVHPWTGEPVPEPCTADGIAAAESTLGFPLPPLLASLHTRIADGGFGPDYGLLPLREAVARYGAQRRGGADGGEDWPWPEGVVPTADLGCAMLACVDFRSEEARVLLFEPNPGEADLAWCVLAPSLSAWLTAWLDGTGWFGDEEFVDDLAPWPDYRARAAAHI